MFKIIQCIKIWNARSEISWEINEGVVSKETVVLRRWGSSIQKFGFINRVDEGLTLETSAFRISVRWPIYIINSVDKTKFLYKLENSQQKPLKICPPLLGRHWRTAIIL